MPNIVYDIDSNNGLVKTPTINDVDAMVNALWTMFEYFLQESQTRSEKMSANGGDPHEHFAYRMTDWGQNKQISQILYGTYAGNTTTYPNETDKGVNENITDAQRGNHNKAGLETSTGGQGGILDIIQSFTTAATALTINFDVSNAVSGTAPSPLIKVPGSIVTLPSDAGLTTNPGWKTFGWVYYPKSSSNVEATAKTQCYETLADGSKKWLRPIELDFGEEWKLPLRHGETITLFLKCSKEIKKIEFDIGDCTGVVPTPIYARVDEEIVLPGTTGIKPPAGKSLVGWSKTSNTSGIDYNFLSTETYDASYIKLYAVYQTTS